MGEENKVSRLMQYALVVAGQAEDFHERSLSPIHLIKYLYLADLDYAGFHEGKTFTGLDWTFHHFGPWSATAYQQMESSLLAVGARKTIVSSEYGDKDFVRWSVASSDAEWGAVKESLPLEIRQSVQHYVGKFHNNTPALLHFVYATPPMLCAAPEERLNFSVAAREGLTKEETMAPFFQRLPPQKQKALAAGMSELRKRFAQKSVNVPPREQQLTLRPDAVFEDGVAWLDRLAGENFPEQGASVHFSEVHLATRSDAASRFSSPVL